MKWFDRRHKSWHTAYNLFGMIAATQQRLPELESYEHAENLIGPGFSQIVRPESGSLPRLVVAWNEATVVCAISGAQTIGMFTGLLDGYFKPVAPGVLSGVNAFAAPSAIDIANFIHGISKGRPCPILVGGYSYGSVIAHGVVYRLAQMMPTAPLSLVSYGGPKPGADLIRNYFATPTSRYRRIISNNDPVPLVVPGRAEAPVLHQAITSSASRAADAYVHPTYAVELDFVGEPSENMDGPSLVTGDQSRAILRWVGGAEGWATSGHHWTTYKQRLFLAAMRYPDLVGEGSPQLVALADQIEVAQGLAAEIPADRLVLPVRVPGDTTQPPPVAPLPFNTRGRRADRRTVYWNGIEIARFSSSKKANAFRNTLRRLRTAVRRAETFETQQIDDAAEMQMQLDATGGASSIG